MDTAKEDETETAQCEAKPSFKKPILIGKIGRLPRKIVKVPDQEENTNVNEEEKSEPEPPAIVEDETPIGIRETQRAQENVLPYREPEWGGMPQSSGRPYHFEVLKSGSIIDRIDLMEKSCWVFGRLPNCDIPMAHPTISRYHAIVQYRNAATETDQQGFYLYDLNSTHGTFFNKMRVKPRTYIRLQVGHMIKLGCSSRTYILAGPDEDTEAPSELSVTELKQKRAEELLRREQERKEFEEKIRLEEEARLKKEEENGIDWGMGEDADEETDISENPYAQTNNEELYLDDPKKALRGFMEREGFELEYDCTEQGMGQFLCRVPLPVDDDRGKQIVAEVLHKGKKKEAVIQCALEACRILDRHGLLRQATHESKKRKARNWEENDYYDSDDDTFLDRTGTVEKKRENRIKNKLPQAPETYQTLLEKERTLHQQITEIERKLRKSKNESASRASEDEDSLDSYMKNLQEVKLDKETITKNKAELHRLKLEHANVIKLVNIARPADLPPLIRHGDAEMGKSGGSAAKKLPIFGKRLKIKVQKPERIETIVNEDSDEESEKDMKIQHTEKITDVPRMVMELDKPVSESETKKNDIQNEDMSKTKSTKIQIKEGSETSTLLSSSSNSKINKSNKHETKKDKSNKHEDEFYKIIKSIPDEEIIEVLNTVWKYPETSEENSEELSHTVKQLDRLVGKCDAKSLIQLKKQLQNFQTNDVKFFESVLAIAKEILNDNTDDSEKKKKRNQRRIHQRQEKVEAEKMRGYEEDAMKSDYNMWVPPEGQTGDGRTSLNDKFGY